MKASLASRGLVLTTAFVGACALGLSPMIDYSALRTERQARFFADGSLIVVLASNPQGGNLALDAEPTLDQQRVVLVAGVTSSGSAGTKTYCRDLAPLSPPSDVPSRVYWRNRSGDLVHIEAIDQGDAARRIAAECRASRKTANPPIRSSALPPNRALQRTALARRR